MNQRGAGAPPSSPSFSVIVATHGRPRLLADALAGVVFQRRTPLEVRIAADGEPADAVDLPEGLLEVTVLPVEVGQAGAARNLAARDARGDVLAFLDDDDRWLPDHLSDLAGAFAEPGVDFAYADVAVIRERLGPRGERIEIERRTIAREWDEALMRRDDYVAPSAWAVRRSLFERVGGFDETFRYSEDWDFLLRIAALTTPRRVPGVTAEVRLRDAGNASANRGAERRTCLDALAERHGFPPPQIKTFWEVAADIGMVAGMSGGRA